MLWPKAEGPKGRVKAVPSNQRCVNDLLDIEIETETEMQAVSAYYK